MRTLAMLLLPMLCMAHDNRSGYEAGFILGRAIDVFASDDQKQYLNADAASGERERTIGGFEFAYRLYDHSSQLWVFGETMHGTRSAEVAQSSDTSTQVLQIIRNATSLSGAVGLRFEFLKLNSAGSDAANVYVRARAGFLKVAGAPGGAMADHALALGVIATDGFFQGSYIEAGWGRSDVFRIKGRKKFDALLTWKFTGPMRAFARVTVDTDLGPGSDGIQSLVGLTFDLREISVSRK